MNYYVTVSFLNLLCYVLLGAAGFAVLHCEDAPLLSQS